MDGSVTRTERGARRRETILSSAADLMARDGYSAVSMAAIGAAAGIVGSGVYRHFDSKAAVLQVLLERVIATMSAGTRELVEAGYQGTDLLEAMMRAQAEVAIANRSLVAVYLRDSGNLPELALRDLRRQQRLLVDEWTRQFAGVAPQLDEPTVRTVVQAVFALINSTATYENPLPVDALVDRVCAMAVAAMRSGLELA